MLRKEVEIAYAAEDVFEFNPICCDAMVNNVMSKLRESASKLFFFRVEPFHGYFLAKQTTVQSEAR